MNIAVIQPQGHGSGATTVAALVASELAIRNKQVCLTNTKPVSEALYPYFNLSAGEDNTPLELMNLIKYGGVKKEKVRNYCRNISDNFDLFVMGTPYRRGVLCEEDFIQAALFFGTNSPFDYTVYDVDEKQLNICGILFIQRKLN